jgi:hypothetical protein
MREPIDHQEAVDEDAALRHYTFNVGDLSRDLAYVTVRRDAARARLVRRDLQRLLAEQPGADVVLEWLGALRREYAGAAGSKY